MKGLVFLTLLLGLVDGRHTVEMAAAEQTVRVDLHLDGEVAAVITGGPPWKAPVELGELAPHRLEAVAYDADGRELGRAEQWLNLPRARAEVNLMVEPTAPGEAYAEIAWKAVEEEAPEEVRVYLDGAAVPVGEWSGDSTRVRLPPHDAGTLHVVTAEVVFPGPLSARADVAFGAPYGDQVASVLTGVAVQVDGRRRLRSADQAGPWLEVEGEAARVVALDEGEADIYAVVDANAHRELDQLAIDLGRRMRNASPEYRLRGVPTGRSALAGSPLRQTGMQEGDRLFLVRPQVENQVGRSRLFGISQPQDDARGGSAWQLSFLRMDPFPDEPQRLADAVATAGMRAIDASRPRGLVVVLGPGLEDDSGLEPARVRRYLDRLGVPVMVLYTDLGMWAEDAATAGGEELDEEAVEAARQRYLEEARERWGDDVVDVDAADDWLRVFSDFRRELARQRVLWIEGRHAPHEVALVDAPRWLSRVGGDLEVR